LSEVGNPQKTTQIIQKIINPEHQYYLQT